MQPEDLLLTTAQLGVAIAGFNGIASALGDRRDPERSARRRFAGSVLVTAASVAVVWSIVPLVLLNAPLSEALVWRISSLGWAIFLASAATLRLRETRALGGRPLASVRAYLVPVAACVALQVWNALGPARAWPHLVGVALSLLTAVSSFFVLAHDGGEGAP